MPAGRPSTYTSAIGEAICEAVATSERGLDFICAARDDFPTARTVHQWMSSRPDFAQAYARAKIRQADFIFAQTIEIADNPVIGVETVTTGEKVETREGDMLGHRRLQIDTRKWIAARLAPMKYGDRVINEHSGPGGGPIKTQTITGEMTPQQAADAYADSLRGED